MQAGKRGRAAGQGKPPAQRRNKRSGPAGPAAKRPGTADRRPGTPGKRFGPSATRTPPGSRSGRSATRTPPGSRSGPSATRAPPGSRSGPSATRAPPGSRSGPSATRASPGSRSGPSAKWAPPGSRSGPSGHRSGPHTHVEPERLQKVLARAGLASRREVEDWIRAERITVNGQTAVLGARAGPTDEVRLDGRVVRQRAAPREEAAFICHRSPGENLRQPVGDEAGEADTATDDDDGAGARSAAAHGSAARAGAAHEATAMVERLPRRAGRRFIAVSPMPHIDGGLELVTSDGELAAKLQRSVRRLSSEFSVRIKGELGADQIANVLQGTLDRGESLAVERCEAAGGEGANRWYSFEARGASGKDVRQLFERQGALVSRVLRTKLGPLALERTLVRGRFRPLTPEELQALTDSPSPGPPPGS